MWTGTNTQIIEFGDDLILQGDENVILDPDNDLIGKVNTTEKWRYDAGLDAFGIGNSAPPKKLTVEGDISSSGDLYLTTDKYIYNDTQTSALRFRDGTISVKSGHFVVQQSASFGTAVDSGKRLTVAGDISASGNFHLEQTASIQYRHFDTGSATLASAGGSMGDIFKFGAGGSTTAGHVCFLDTNGVWQSARADSGATATGSLGVLLGSSAETDGILMRGITKLSSDPGGSIGAPLYLSDANAGQVILTPPDTPNDIVRVVGYNMGNSGLVYFNPDNTWVEIA